MLCGSVGHGEFCFPKVGERNHLLKLSLLAEQLCIILTEGS